MESSWLARIVSGKSRHDRRGRKPWSSGWRRFIGLASHGNVRGNRIPKSAKNGAYVLQTGEAAAYRLDILQQLYGPGTHQLLRNAGLRPGMSVADIGCGVGTVTAVLSEMVGSEGQVVGFDISAAQLDQAGKRLNTCPVNFSFVEASAVETRWPDESFDLVYCRFLLMHLQEPERALCEMRRLLKPEGILVCEDGDLTSAGSLPPSALDAFADLFRRLSPMRRVDYRLGTRLYQMVLSAGFEGPEIQYNQPVVARGECKRLLELSLAEAGPAFVDSGLITAAELDETLWEMRQLAEDENVLAVMPRMSQVWARKPACLSLSDTDWESRVQRALAS